MQNIITFLQNKETNETNLDRNSYLQNRFKNANNLYSKDLKGHFNCVNALEFSNLDCCHFVSGGDDKRVLLWNINKDVLANNTKPSPHIMRGQHHSNIFTLAWDNENNKIISGGNDSQIIVHDVST
jgi:DDB1- and CUL4-associated factor 5